MSILKVLIVLTLTDGAPFRPLLDRGGGATKPPPLSRKLLQIETKKNYGRSCVFIEQNYSS